MKIPDILSLPKTVTLGSIIIAAISLLIGIMLGFWFDTEPYRVIEERRMNDKSATYSFVNPLLDYEQDIQTPLRSEMKSLENSIKDLIQTAIEDGLIQNASVYYRDLNNGPWLSINDSLVYTPASLLKVPLMMSFFKQAETEPSILEELITYSAKIEAPKHSLGQATSTVTLGSTYTVLEMIELMMVYSDNVATLLLLEKIDPATKEKVYRDLALPFPDLFNHNKSYITAREYSSFFRILYNSTYLKPDYSEKALQILSRSDFKLGIEAGLPPGTKVSHKFGVSTNTENVKQLHDCGIVYSNHSAPYSLCIMTSGRDFYKMASVIGEVTALIDGAVARDSEGF